jgi:putative tryptophan/tyrosine transport system substrate-binding protein
VRRREFIAGLGGAVAWPLAARAQQSTTHVIGFLTVGPLEPKLKTVLLQGLAETGYVEGRNLTIEFRFAQNIDQLPELAADLVRRGVAVIVTGGSTPAALAAKAATTAIPIVFGVGTDPLQTGLVTRLNRPGGNVTGFSEMNLEVGPKRLALLHELVPNAMRFGVLINPKNPGIAEFAISEAQAAAGTIGAQIEVLGASSEPDIDAIFASFVQRRVDALLVSPDLLFYASRLKLAALAGRHSVPAIYWDSALVKAGGLISYGSSVPDMVRQIALYAGRVLNGEKPADLPVLQPTKFELVINLTAAKALGPTIPETGHRRRGDSARRREFIAGLAAATVGRPLEAWAQQARRVAFMTTFKSASDPRVAALEHGLEARGWMIDRNLVIDYRFGVDSTAAANDAIAELLKLRPEIILTNGGAALAAAQRATNSIPIVFTGVSEPVTRGFVQSLAHPGGNITGFANLEPTFGAKWFQLLKEIVPSIERVAVVFSPALSGAQLFYRSIEAAAQGFSVKVVAIHVQSPSDFRRGIEAFAGSPNEGLINVPDGFSEGHRDTLVAQAARYRLPAVYPFQSFARAGGLASYGNDERDSHQQASTYVDRILRGERPSDLPVNQPTKFELVINLKTANALGLTIPETLLATADEVIQ